MTHKPFSAVVLLVTALAASGCAPNAAGPSPAPHARPGGSTSAAPAAVAVAPTAGERIGSTTILVVRHAERASATDRDSPLSDAGRDRAMALSEALADAGIDAVFTSQYIRTRDTAAPLADRLGLPITVDSVAAAEASSRALAERVLTEHRGETVLIVGHSNTVSLIVRALGGPQMAELDESDYDNLFTVVVHPSGEVGTLRARFGAPD